MSKSLETNYKNNRGKVGLSALLIVSLLVVTGVIQLAQRNETKAAAITLASDTMNNSAPSSTAVATSNHALAFTLPTALSASDTITITFPAAFSTSSGIDFNDFDIATTTDFTLGDVSSGATWGATTSGDFVITFTVGSEGTSAGATMTVEIGDNATFGGTGNSYIQNPAKSEPVGTADIYAISIGGTSDSGDVLVAIIEPVTVSVTIDESLSFTIAPVDLGDCNTKFGTEAGATTTTTTVPFGTVSTPNTFQHGCHDLSVSTNASSGYVLTTQTDTSLKAAAILIDSGTCDGTCSETATDTWATETSNAGFAYSATGTDAIIRSTLQYKRFACTGAVTTDCLPAGSETAQNLASNSGPVDSSTTTIEYKLSFLGTQQAGTYSNVVTYIVTPTF